MPNLAQKYSLRMLSAMQAGRLKYLIPKRSSSR
jgi:hypothetical protein